MNTRPPLPRCDHPGCSGHLGKFSSCLDEWLYDCSLDGTSETFGDTDWLGHYAVLEVSDDPSWTAPADTSWGGHAITPAVGVWVVYTTPSGFVETYYYADMSAMEADMEATRTAYEAWSAQYGDEY